MRFSVRASASAAFRRFFFPVDVNALYKAFVVSACYAGVPLLLSMSSQPKA